MLELASPQLWPLLVGHMTPYGGLAVRMQVRCCRWAVAEDTQLQQVVVRSETGLPVLLATALEMNAGVCMHHCSQTLSHPGCEADKLSHTSRPGKSRRCLDRCYLLLFQTQGAWQVHQQAINISMFACMQ